MKGADHSTGGAIIGGTLAKSGVKGIVRYAAAGRADVNITPGEIKDLEENGIEIGIVNEHAADYLLDGAAVGKQRATEAQEIATACGLPEGVVYMAADFDVTLGGFTHPGSPGDANMQKVAATLEGAREGIGQNNVGFYGSFFAIDWLTHNCPWIKYYWQTLAWSMGQMHPARNLYQYASQESYAGVSCDNDELVTIDWGQRTHKPEASVATVHGAPPVKTAAGHFNVGMSLLANNEVWTVTPEKSSDVHFGEEDQLVVLAVGVHTGGPKRGEWVHKKMPKNWQPPNGW